MTIRLVASDLDGTLFQPDHLVSERAVTAINALVDAGAVVAAVTGRSWQTGLEIATSTGARLDYFVGANGGHRFNLRTDEMEERLVFEPDEIAPLIKTLLDTFPDIALMTEHATGYWHNDQTFELLPMSLEGRPRRNSAEFRPDDVGKLLMLRPDMSSTDLIAQTRELVPDSMHYTSSGLLFAEVTPAGASKGEALARLCGQLDIDRSEVIAFGDNHNDLSMIEWAGRGVAMGNAEPEVKAVAQEIAPPNWEDGVAQILETLLP
ncbi:MAG: Cof-type HAD-IIB family hydrolase [Actinomycetota bacterium]